MSQHLINSVKKLLLKGAFIATMLSTVSCDAERAEVPKISGLEAFDFASKLYNFGPRPSGSATMLRQVEFIKDEIRKTGAELTIDEFQDKTPAGQIKFTNIIASVKGSSDKFIIIGSHYDTKRIESAPAFAGANDGASSSGLLLAMIKAVCESGRKPYYTLRFVFFDGEECLYKFKDGDGLHGSKHYAALLKTNSELKKCRAMILLDMVGDKELSITIPSGASTDPALAGALFKSAETAGHAKYFSWFQNDMLDDHVPFVKEGIPSIDIIDFEFGPGNAYWHTSSDTLDKISAESLDIVGNTVMPFIWNLN